MTGQLQVAWYVFDGRDAMAAAEYGPGRDPGRWWARCAPLGVVSHDRRRVRSDVQVWAQTGPPLPLYGTSRMLGSVWMAMVLSSPDGLELGMAGTLLDGVPITELLAGWPALDLVAPTSGPGLSPTLTWDGLWEYDELGLRGLFVADRPAWPGRVEFLAGVPPWLPVA